jgi:hypothetical protein
MRFFCDFPLNSIKFPKALRQFALQTHQLHIDNLKHPLDLTIMHGEHFHQLRESSILMITILYSLTFWMDGRFGQIVVMGVIGT